MPAVNVDSVNKPEISTENQVASNSRIKASSFDSSVPWHVSRLQFEAAAYFNSWTLPERVANLMLSLKGTAAHVLRTLPPGKFHYNPLVQWYGDSHQQNVYRCHLKCQLQ